MKGLTAILVMVSAIVIAVVVLAVMTFRPAAAATRPQGRMQLCTAQWLDRHEPDRSGYKPFMRECLTGATGVTVSAKTGKAVASRATGKTSAAKKSGPKKPNRMSVCAAQWRQEKASGKTGGQTYRQFSSQCLRAH